MRYIWIDKEKENYEQEVNNAIFLFLRNGYDCVVKDEGCGIAIYFVCSDPDMEESIVMLEDASKFVVSESEWDSRYNQGVDETRYEFFEELKTMADDDLYEAMSKALDYKEA